MTTVTVTTSIALTLAAQKQALLAKIPAAEFQKITLELPESYIDLCVIDMHGKATLPQLLQRSLLTPSDAYHVSDIAELSDGAMLMQRWESRAEKMRAENRVFLEQFAGAIKDSKAEIEAEISKGILHTPVKNHTISLKFLNARQGKLQYGQQEYSPIAENIIEKGTIPGGVEAYFKEIKDDWFLEMLQSLKVHREFFLATKQAVESALAQKLAKNNELEEKRKAEQEIKEEEGARALLDWAKKHGSERLKLMIELDTGEFTSVAEYEFVDAHCPEGFSRGAYHAYGNKTETRKRPTLPELQALKELKALKAIHPGLYLDEELTWAAYESERQEFTEFSQAVLEVNVVTPTSKTITIAMPFPATRKTE